MILTPSKIPFPCLRCGIYVFNEKEEPLGVYINDKFEEFTSEQQSIISWKSSKSLQQDQRIKFELDIVDDENEDEEDNDD